MSARVRRAKAMHRYRQIARLVSEADPAAAALRFCIGDIVVPTDPKAHPLRCGPTFVAPYFDADQAIVIRLSPFLLTMTMADAVDLGLAGLDQIIRSDRWIQIREPSHYRIVGQASSEQMRTTFEEIDAIEPKLANALGVEGRESPLLFDVHAARAYGERLLAMADEYEVFADWTRTRGQGPENFINGRWPGPWAREYSRHLRSGSASGAIVKVGFANGKIMAKLGRRLLDALEGQPSECPACSSAIAWHGVTFAAADSGVVQARQGQTVAFVTSPDLMVIGKDGNPRTAVVGEPVITTCSDCRGTGHNLAGTLPPMQVEFTGRRRMTADTIERMMLAARGRDLDQRD